MKFLDNLKMMPKLIGAFLVLCALMVGMGVLAIFEIREIESADTRLYEKMTVPLGQMGDIMQFQQRVRVNVRDAIMTGEAERYGKRMDEISVDLDKVETEFQKTLLTPMGKSAWAAYKEVDKRNDELQKKMMELVKAGKPQQAELILRGDGYKTTQELNKALEAMQNLKLDLAKKTAEENAKVATAANRAMLIFMVVAVLLGVGMGIVIARSIAGPLAQGVTMMVEMAKGHLSTRLKMGRKDEIGDLARAMDTFTDDLQGIVKGLQQIAAGDLSRDFQAIDAQDEINPALKQATESLRAMAADAQMLAAAAVDGKLATRADASKFQGEYRRIVQGVNDTLDAVIGPLNVAAGYVDRISKGDIPPKITDKYNGDFNEIKNNLNQCVDAVNALVADAAMLSKAAVEGKLATRAEATKHQGDFRKIVQGVNETLDAVIGPLNVAAGYVDRISKGDIPPKITDSYNGDFNEIKNNLNQCVDAVNALVADAGMLSKAAVDGKLATRAEAAKHQGDFRRIVQGVNETLDAVIGPLNVAAGYVDRISKGDIPPKITDNYNGDFNEIKNNLNQCVDAVNALVADAVMLSKAAVDGKLATRAEASKHQGEFRRIVQGVNETLDAVIGPLNVAAGYVDKISKGDIPAKITDNYNGDFNEIKNNLNQAIDAVNAMVADAAMLGKAAVEGKLATRADATRHLGDFRKIVQGVNETLDAVIGPLNVAAGYVDKISKGEIPPVITDNYNGDFNTIKNNLNSMVKMMSSLLSETDGLVKAAVSGQLTTRANSKQFVGGWFELVDGVNQTLDAVVAPINDVMRVMGTIEKGDLTARITTAYQGDFLKLAQAINNSATRLAQTLTEISSAANTLASSSDELSSSSSTMAGTADAMTQQANTAAAGTEQASANVKNMAAGVEQISANSTTVASASEEVNANLRTVGAAVEEMSANMRTIAGASEQMTGSVNTVAAAIEEMSVSLNEVSKNSGQAATVASKAARSASTTAETVDKLGRSAQEIGKVVDMIKGIAAQTNLLALNATIEAASAGEAGKGFAVVANEVKELAKQTAGATEEIRAQVEGMQANTQQAVKAIDEIVQIINEINTISGTIAAAVEEQTATTNEISKNVGNAARGATDVARNVQQAATGANEVSRNVQEAVKGVTDITRNINQLASGATDVARNASEAAKGMNDVARNVATVSTAARDTTRGATDTNTAAKELARLAERLQANVATFKL